MKHVKGHLISTLLFLSIFLGFFMQETFVLAERNVNFYPDNGSITTLELKVNPENPSSKGEHWAIIVGVSDYKAINDLRFCDDDANDWFLYFTNLGYEHITVLGDHSNYYLQYDGLATEYNLKQTLLNVVSQAGANDMISFVTSGHGSGDHQGTSLLCMWDCASGENGEDGLLFDYELASIISLAVSQEIFIFIDHCFAGGFGPDLLSLENGNNIYLAAACTDKGMGWDAYAYENGLWTYFFLEYTLVNYFESHPKTTMERAFAYALSYYQYHTGVMVPEEYDGNLDQFFVLW